MILSVCDSPEVLSSIRIVKIIINFIKVLVPLILIVSGSLTFTKATANGENQKAFSVFIRKCIAAITIFMIPTVVGIIAKLTYTQVDYMKCIANANKEGIDQAYVTQAKLVLNNLQGDISQETYNQARIVIDNIKDPELKAQELEKLKTYAAYVSIKKALENLVNNNTKENRDKIQAEIDKLSDSDNMKKTFQERLDKYSKSGKGGVSLGIASGYYKGHNGKLDYYVYFPPEAKTNMPLIVWLHGDNPRVEWATNNHIGPTAYKAGVPVILVAPFAGTNFGSSSNPGWFEGGLLPNVKAIVEEVCNKYSCDRSNINIGGHSRGAIGTWMMVSRYPNYFHSAAPVSCCAGNGFQASSFKGMKVWAWRGSNAGTGDNNDNIYAGCMQSSVNSVKPYAREVKYTILPNTTHGDATNELSRSEEFVRFMFEP